MNKPTAAYFMLVLLTGVQGHGRLMEPPSRSSMWRVGFDSEPNFTDNQLNCGGFSNQWISHQGKCGICGDPFQGPRENEAGGKYAKGQIVRHYSQGQVIDVTVEITANHLGYFEFRLCPNNNTGKEASQMCLDQHQLELADGSGNRYHITPNTGNFHVKARLPPGVTCSQCVLQWKYHAGNNFGIGPDGKSCKGCGPQEEFYGCADIAISGQGEGTPTLPSSPLSHPSSHNPPVTTARPHTSQPVSSPQPQQPGTCQAVNVWAGNSDVDQWCVVNCAANFCPADMCKCN